MSFEYLLTTWANPTKDDVSFKLWKGPETVRDCWIKVNVPAGGEVGLPAEYDTAVLQKAPQLKKKLAPADKVAEAAKK